MKNLIILLFTITCFSQSTIDNKTKVDLLLNNWHKAAANANFDVYFNLMTDNAVFIGTDATEYWNKTEFMTYAKPYFDKGKAWSFTAIERHIYFSKNNKIAWFDELLSTQMKICRGSGVAIKTKSGWKITHYVLSMTIPNSVSDEVIKIKSNKENIIMERLKI